MTTNHAVRKTPRMVEIEDDSGGDITDLILAALVTFPTDAAAAAEVGVDPSTLNLWIMRLGLIADANHARQQR